MNKNHSFIGSNVALITPMFDDGAVDYEALNHLIDFHIDSGTSSIVSVGTTGESATVGIKEHLKIINHLMGSELCIKIYNFKILILTDRKFL